MKPFGFCDSPKVALEDHMLEGCKFYTSGGSKRRLPNLYEWVLHISPVCRGRVCMIVYCHH